MKTRPGVVITATLALFYDQVVSGHQDTQAPLFELALDNAAEAGKNWPVVDPEVVEVSTVDMEAALENLIDRAKRQIDRLRAAMELRGEA